MNRQEMRRKIWRYLAVTVESGMIGTWEKELLSNADRLKWYEEEHRIGKIIKDNFAGGRRK